MKRTQKSVSSANSAKLTGVTELSGYQQSDHGGADACPAERFPLTEGAIWRETGERRAHADAHLLRRCVQALADRGPQSFRYHGPDCSTMSP